MNVRSRLGQTATYVIYRFMSWLGPLLPTRSGRSAYMTLGRLLYRVAPSIRATVAANQAQVLGRPAEDLLVQASTREAFALYARYWFDTFNALGWDDDRLREAFRFDGIEHVEKALADGMGAVIALTWAGSSPSIWSGTGSWRSSRTAICRAAASRSRCSAGPGGCRPGRRCCRSRPGRRSCPAPRSRRGMAGWRC
jgi:hypothetical protein